MISFEEAKQLALKFDPEISTKSAFDDGDYYIFSGEEEVELPPIGVHKVTGKVNAYFPFHHPKYKDAVEVR